MAHRRQRHLMFSSKALGASVSYFAPAITGLSDGDAVRTWSDISGNSRDASQATTSQKPTFVTASAGGFPAVNFDSANSQCLATSAYSANQLFTVLTVFYGTGNGLIYERGSNYTVAGCHDLAPSTNVSSWIFGSPTSSGRDISTNWALGGVWRVISQEYNGSNTTNQVYLNGAAATMINTAQAGSPAGTTSYSLALNLGSRNQTGSFISGKYAAFAIFNPMLKSSLRKRIEKSLGFAFKISGS